MQAASFSTARPDAVKTEINRGIAAARAQRDVERVNRALADSPYRTASKLRAQRLDEYRIEYETRAWGYLALGVAIGAAIVGIAVAVMAWR